MKTKTFIPVALLLSALAPSAIAQSLGFEAARSDLVVTGEARAINGTERLALFELQVRESIRGVAPSRLVVAIPTHVSNHADLPLGRPVLVHLVRAPENDLFARARSLAGDLYLLRPQPLGTVRLDEPEGAELLAVARRLAEIDRLADEQVADRASALADLFGTYLDGDLPRTLASLSRDLSEAALAEIDSADRARIVDRLITAEPEIAAPLIQVAAAAGIREAAEPILERALSDSTGRLVVDAAGALSLLGPPSLEPVWRGIASSEDLGQVARSSELVLRLDSRTALPRLRSLIESADRDRALTVLSTFRVLPRRLVMGTVSAVAEAHGDEVVRGAARQLIGR